MSENTLEPSVATPGSEAADKPTPDWYHPQRPTATFMGNTFDLASLGALAGGLLMIFLCVTCNMGLYCLPVVPILLGLFGLLSARQAVNEERTRLWSWIGLGTGGAALFLIALGVFLYFGMLFLMFATNRPQ